MNSAGVLKRLLGLFLPEKIAGIICFLFLTKEQKSPEKAVELTRGGPVSVAYYTIQATTDRSISCPVLVPSSQVP